jgi:predicted murein hydrolase (TIGR00659 family)
MIAFGELTQHPAFGITLTVGCYVAGLQIQKRWRWFHPLFAATAAIMLLLVVARIPYEHYDAGGRMISFFLGPATVALALPIYVSIRKLQRKLVFVLIGIVAGCVTGMSSILLLGWLFNSNPEILFALLPKSATTPIAIELSMQLGGIPELGGIFAVLTGLAGSLFGPMLLRWAGIRGDLAIGTAIGTAAHGIGTARVLQDSERQGGIAGLAMGLTGIVLSLLCIPIFWWLRYN